jgi:hypothetical protein
MNETCKLCGKNRELRYSHIIPEFLYKPLYDQKGRAFIADSRFLSREYLQNGLREYLLCDVCEGDFGEVERRVSETWDLPASSDVSVYRLPVPSFTDLKFLWLSVLWRASVSTLNEFAAVSLGRHESVVRQKLISGSVGPSSDFPIVGRLLVVPNDGRVFKELLSSPIAACLDGWDGWLFVICGLAWFCGPGPICLALKSGSLPEVGSWPLPVVQFESLEALEASFRQ